MGIMAWTGPAAADIRAILLPPLLALLAWVHSGVYDGATIAAKNMPSYAENCNISETVHYTGAAKAHKNNLLLDIWRTIL